MDFFEESKYRKSININMSGKEYLDHLKYQDNKSKNSWKAVKSLIYQWRYFISAILIYLLGSLFIQTIFPVTPVNYGVFNIGSFVFPYIVLYVLIFMIAIAWIIHGFGFIIVRR